MNLGSGISQMEFVRLMEYVRDQKIPLSNIYKALKALGLEQKISEKTAQHLIKTAAQEGSKLAAQALAASASGGGLILGTLTAIGEWLGLTGAAAAVAGGLIVTAVLGGLTYAGANLAGSYAADSPVLAGDPARRQAQTQAPQRSADFKPASGAIDSSGEWMLTWNWSVTTVHFVGTVTGGPGAWTFQGSLESGGNAIWTPAKGSAQAQCTLTGEPGESGAPARMSCTATFPEPWQGESEGTVQTISSGDRIKFEYRGRGKGTVGPSEASGIDHLDLSPKS